MQPQHPTLEHLPQPGTSRQRLPPEREVLLDLVRPAAVNQLLQGPAAIDEVPNGSLPIDHVVTGWEVPHPFSQHRTTTFAPGAVKLSEQARRLLARIQDRQVEE